MNRVQGYFNHKGRKLCRRLLAAVILEKCHSKVMQQMQSQYYFNKMRPELKVSYGCSSNLLNECHTSIYIRGNSFSTYVPPDTHTYVCVSGKKKCQFFGRFCIRTKGVMPNIRFRLFNPLQAEILFLYPLKKWKKASAFLMRKGLLA